MSPADVAVPIRSLFRVGFRTRMIVFLNWVWAYFTYGLGARLVTGRQTTQRPDLRSDGPEPRAGG